MPVEKTAASPAPTRQRDFWVALLCLLGVLAVLFHRSFESYQIVFSNDGPLGPHRSQSEFAATNFKGYWQDLNWLGMEVPGYFLDLSGLLLAGLCVLSPDFGPVLISKFYAPIGILVLGLSVWVFFRQLRFRPWVCVLGGLAAALNSTAFSLACWGLPTWPLSWAMNMLALAAVAAPSIRRWWLKAVLAGLCVGLGVMEGFDVGAILSVFTAGFVFFWRAAGDGSSFKKAGQSLVFVFLMTVFAGLIAAQAVDNLVSTQVKGIAGLAQDEATKQQRWYQVTAGSLPKAETLRIIIPGLFGYRMPELYGESEESAGGSNYWGAVGQMPGVTQSRHSGGSFYAGVLVAVVAAFGGAQSLRKKGSPFLPPEQRQAWCWLGILTVSILLAWGRFAPFYRILYEIPYCSTVRNPFKFMFPFSLALVVLFGYGLEAIQRAYLGKLEAKPQGWTTLLKSWWRMAPTFERRWTTGSVIAVAASLVGWLMYAASKNALLDYLRQAGFTNEPVAQSIVRFSLGEVGWFILFLILSTSTLILILSGVFSGQRAKWAGAILGFLLVTDLARANTPWITYWNYREKYASNPIIDLLREKPYERRLTGDLVPLSHSYLINAEGRNLVALYGSEWLQHLFPYYRIQSLDVIQMPREPEFDQAYMLAFRPPNGTNLFRCGRIWELTNTRYVLAMTGFLPYLNTLIDPVHQRFRVHTAFNIAPKSDALAVTTAAQLTAVPDPNGQFALLEFTGALPRAMLFTRWLGNTNDETTLKTLADPAFDPARTVLVASDLPKPASLAETNAAPGAVQITRYEPKRVEIQADVSAPSVLLLNDRFDPQWNVTVDGKPETLLRCNYIMRGVFLTPGKHTVVFRFQTPATAFYISLIALLTGLGLCAFLVLSPNRVAVPASTPRPIPPPATGNSRKSK